MRVPTSPIMAPWIRKIRPTAGAVIPIARRMPISRVLSATTMVSVLTMLNAATSMMKKMIRPIASFSSLSALNESLILGLPVERAIGIAEAIRSSRAPTSGARSGSRIRTSMPDTASPSPANPGRLERDDDELVVVLEHPRVEEPVTSNCQYARHRRRRARRSPSGRERNERDRRRPGRPMSRSASRVPSTMPPSRRAPRREAKNRPADRPAAAR